MNYDQLMQYFTELESGTNKLSLEPTRNLLQALGNPQNSFKSIHVAGTNGKGSTTAMIHSVLSQKYKTGRFISPHLIDIKERLRVNDQDITEDELVKIAVKVKAAAESINLQVSYFEFITACAFLFYKEQQCDFAVIEVGLGGRLDSTNVLDSEIAVITNIDLDHTRILGDNIIDIAREKAGIIKENSVLVTGEDNLDVLNLFENICREKNTKLVIAKPTSFKSWLLGEYQQKNAKLAVTALQQLGVDNEMIERGLLHTFWPGRFELMQQSPQVILDCAHNPAGMQALVNSIKKLEYDKLILVLGISKNKDIEEMTKTILPLTDKVVCTEASYRALNAEELSNYASGSLVVKPVIDAVKKALEIARENDLVLICGSIFVIGEARTLWHPHKVKFFR